MTKESHKNKPATPRSRHPELVSGSESGNKPKPYADYSLRIVIYVYIKSQL